MFREETAEVKEPEKLSLRNQEVAMPDVAVEDDPAYQLLELVRRIEKGFDHGRVEVCSRGPQNFLDSGIERDGLVVRPGDRERIEGVGHGKDARPVRDLIALE